MKGFICEICKDEDVIFAFDVASCTQVRTATENMWIVVCV